MSEKKSRRYVTVVNAEGIEWLNDVNAIGHAMKNGNIIPIQLRAHDVCDIEDGSDKLYPKQVRAYRFTEGTWKYIGNVWAGSTSKVQVPDVGFDPMITGDKLYTFLKEHLPSDENMTVKVYVVASVMIDADAGYSALICCDEKTQPRESDAVVTTKEPEPKGDRSMEKRNVRKHAGETVKYTVESSKDAGKAFLEAGKTVIDIGRLSVPAVNKARNGLGSALTWFGKVIKVNKEDASE